MELLGRVVSVYLALCANLCYVFHPPQCLRALVGAHAQQHVVLPVTLILTFLLSVQWDCFMASIYLC